MKDIDERFANLLAGYCLRVEKGDRILLQGGMPAIPLLDQLAKVILKMGGSPILQLHSERYDEIIFEQATPDQLETILTFTRTAYETFEGRVRIQSDVNTSYLDHLPPDRLSSISQVNSPILKAQFDRGAQGAFKWVTTIYPTTGYAQAAGMGTEEFARLIYRACHIGKHGEDPIEYWTSLQASNKELASILSEHQQVTLRGPDCELSFSIEGRVFEGDSGENNMPGGEVFTAPVEDSVQGRIKFSYPITVGGALLDGVSLTFDKGKAVKAEADRGQEALYALLASDEGACYLGEFGIGTNRDIEKPVGRGLLDEKIAGTIHLALGRAYPEVGGKNESGIHVDIIKDMSRDSEILFDGEVLYRNGEFLM
jgi:aminopeptidase